MLIALRILVTIILVPATAFCGFGFLASGEADRAQAANSYRLLYGTGFLVNVGAIVVIWLVKARKR